MAFPFDVLDQRIEINLGGTWTDITSYVQRRDNLVTIRRGRSDEASSLERSTGRMSLNNRDGRFSVKNPLGAYYGLINRNTRLRHSLPSVSGSYLDLPGSITDEATCPDAAALGITGDIDIRIDLSPDSWRTLQPLAGKWEATSDEQSWALQLNADGTLTLLWTTSGDIGTVLYSASTLPVPTPGSHRRAVRATLDVNNGAGGHTARFYYADTISGSWTQLGSDVVTTGTTSIYDGTAGLEVGSVADLDPGEPYVGRVHAFELRSGIAGTVVANPNFTIQTAGDNSFADTASSPNTWTISGNAGIDDRDYRLYAEVPAWPARWDTTGSDIWVPIEASGLLRRNGQGARPLQSTLRRFINSLASRQPVAYWPCEDSSSATRIASGLPGGQPMSFTGSPSFGSSSDFVCSAALPTVSNSIWTGPVPAYTRVGSSTDMRWLMAIPATGLVNNSVVMRITTSDATTHRWDLTYTTADGGTLTPNAYDKYGTLLHTGSGILDMNGFAGYWQWRGSDSGGDIGYDITGLDLVTLNAFGTTGGITSAAFGTITSVSVGSTGNVEGAVIGHISVHDEELSTDTLVNPLIAFNGESAGRRMQRLCAEEGVTLRFYGDLDGTPAMGPQPIDTLLALIGECVTVDGGILSEPRNAFGLGYRPRLSLYNQPTTLSVDYAAGELFGELAPTDDDRYLRNQWIASRRNGSSATAALESGALSVQEPPDGVGLYEDQVTLNCLTDDVLPDQASWRVHLGTVEENRYQSLSVNVANPRIAADSALVAAVSVVDLGDVVTVTNPPSSVPPGDIEQLVQGITEQYGNYEWLVTINGSPSSPYTVAVADDDVLARADTDGAALGADATNSATTLIVATTQSTTAVPQWITSGDFPVDLRVGGEVVTASAAAIFFGDNFNRSVSNGWGSTSTGSYAWQLDGGAASERSCSSNRANVVLTSAPTTLRAQTVAQECTDCEVRLVTAVSQLATGGSLTPAVLMRWVDSSNFYRLRVHFTTGGNVSMSVTRGSTVIGSTDATGYTYTAGAVFQVRVRLVGHRILARVWPSGDSEAGIWHIDRTITSSTIESGYVGLGAAGLTGNTNVNPELRYDGLTIDNPQRLTVTRSVNGIVKAQTAGTDVRLATPSIVSF